MPDGAEDPNIRVEDMEDMQQDLAEARNRRRSVRRLMTSGFEAEEREITEPTGQASPPSSWNTTDSRVHRRSFETEETEGFDSTGRALPPSARNTTDHWVHPRRHLLARSRSSRSKRTKKQSRSRSSKVRSEERRRRRRRAKLQERNRVQRCPRKVCEGYLHLLSTTSDASSSSTIYFQRCPGMASRLQFTVSLPDNGSQGNTCCCVQAHIASRA